jgi:hypothetical protein
MRLDNYGNCSSVLSLAALIPNNGDVYVSNEDPGRVSVINVPRRDR